MKRKLILFLLLCLLLVPTQISSSFAYVQNAKIDTLNDFKEEINRLYTTNAKLTPESPEIKLLVEKTNPVVIKKFLDEKFNMLEFYLSQNSSILKKQNINLGDNCYLKINNCYPSIDYSPFASTPGGQTLWKDYGDRKFTSTFEGFLAVASFDLNICNHYALSSSGISPRYVEAWGRGSGVINVSHGTIYEPKRYAGVGETVSANCIFTLNGSASILQYQKSFKMYNYVKCSEIDTIEKQVKVVQSWRGDWL